MWERRSRLESRGSAVLLCALRVANTLRVTWRWGDSGTIPDLVADFLLVLFPVASAAAAEEDDGDDDEEEEDDDDGHGDDAWGVGGWRRKEAVSSGSKFKTMNLHLVVAEQQQQRAGEAAGLRTRCDFELQDAVLGADPVAGDAAVRPRRAVGGILHRDGAAHQVCSTDGEHR